MKLDFNRRLGEINSGTRMQQAFGFMILITETKGLLPTMGAFSQSISKVKINRNIMTQMKKMRD